MTANNNCAYFALLLPIPGSDIKRLDSCAEVFSQAGDANNFGDFGSEDSFIIEVQFIMIIQSIS